MAQAYNKFDTLASVRQVLRGMDINKLSTRNYEHLSPKKPQVTIAGLKQFQVLLSDGAGILHIQYMSKLSYELCQGTYST